MITTGSERDRPEVARRPASGRPLWPSGFGPTWKPGRRGPEFPGEVVGPPARQRYRRDRYRHGTARLAPTPSAAGRIKTASGAGRATTFSSPGTATVASSAANSTLRRLYGTRRSRGAGRAGPTGCGVRRTSRSMVGTPASNRRMPRARTAVADRTEPTRYRVLPERSRESIFAARQARSSVVEHYLDMVGVAGSIPAAPTSFRARRIPRRTGPCRKSRSPGPLAVAGLGQAGTNVVQAAREPSSSAGGPSGAGNGVGGARRSRSMRRRAVGPTDTGTRVADHPADRAARHQPRT